MTEAKSRPMKDNFEWSQRTVDLWDVHCLLEEITKHPTPGDIEEIEKKYNHILSMRDLLILANIRRSLEKNRSLLSMMTKDLGNRFSEAEAGDLANAE